MIRKLLFTLAAVSFAPVAWGQDTIDAFDFPQFEEVKVPSLSSPQTNETMVGTVPSSRQAPIISSPLETDSSKVETPHDKVVEGEVSSMPADALSKDTPTRENSRPVTTSATPSSLPPVQESVLSPIQPKAHVRFSGYMPSGPSAPSPLLAYMQCAHNSCPDVWAGYAYQHQKDLAAYCSQHGCNSHACGCAGSNRYAEPCLSGGCGTCGLAGAKVNRYHAHAPTSTCDSCTGQ